MQHVDQNRAELREINELYFSRTDSRMDARFAQFELMLTGHLAAVREDLHGMDMKYHAGVASLDAKIERRFADLLKWSFVFWVGTVAAIAVLANVLR